MDNEFNNDWKKVYGAYQNNTILQGWMTGIETLLDKPCSVVTFGKIRGFIPLEFTVSRQITPAPSDDMTVCCVQSYEL
ncbi:hypothetical protein [Sporosarcina sp. E16_8]|uniref:hypothetical protein n=1 Tax=Sporosarcina sp. E16_8 TaxID=2789295 RepID=UPI001A92DC3E|nr:hypothetical protein [Sporosarcina sp. E16_8]MBO0587767.1 hypothetical protein [Sporosarcina sp. E16_8]